MKKIYNLFVVLAAVMLIAACGKESNPYQEPDKTIEVVATDVVFGPEGGNGEVEFTASGTVGVVSNRDWCTASVAGTKVNVTVTEWEGVETRYAILTLKCGAYSVDVTVQQNGTILGGLTGAEIVADSKGTTQVFEVKVSGSVTTSSAVDWASVSYVDGVVTVTVDANADPFTRFGEVTVAAGENSHSISIKQYPEFKTTASWTLSYDGRARSSSGTLYEVISNEVEAGSSEGLYFLTMSSEAAFKASKIKKLDDFIAAVAAEAEETRIQTMISSLSRSLASTMQLPLVMTRMVILPVCTLTASSRLSRLRMLKVGMQSMPDLMYLVQLFMTWLISPQVKKIHTML